MIAEDLQYLSTTSEIKQRFYTISVSREAFSGVFQVFKEACLRKKNSKWIKPLNYSMCTWEMADKDTDNLVKLHYWLSLMFNFCENSKKKLNFIIPFLKIFFKRIVDVIRNIYNVYIMLFSRKLVLWKRRFNDLSFTVLRQAQEFFTYMKTSPLPVKGCKI